MRVILKPAGAIMVAGTVSLLGIFAFTQMGKGGKAPVDVAVAAPATDIAAPPTEVRSVFVNMDTVGKHDWVFWKDDKTFVRKAKVTPLVGPLEVVGGTAHPFASNIRTFSWSDGATIGKGSNAHEGVKVSGKGSGFRFSVPATTDTAHNLRVYIGGFQAGCIFQAKLSDGSEPERIDMAESVGSGGHFVRLYTIRFKAKQPDQKLMVSWICSTGSGNGYVTAQAAAVE